MSTPGMSAMPILFVIVPALLGLAGLWLLIGSVRELLRNSALARNGLTVDGRVVSSNLKITSSGGRDSNARSRLVETIEFTTANGQRVRGVPVYSDVGMLDRTGEQVTVLHQRDRPDQFIAPRNGRSISPAGPLLKIVFSFVFLGFLAFFITMSLSMFGQMGQIFGG